MAASQTRFGAIPIRIFRLGQGAAIANGWNRPSYTAEEHVPGSDRTITFVLGRGARDVTWPIECRLEDYPVLEDAVQTTATLVAPHGTQNAPATVVDEFGDLYDHLDGVLLMGLANAVVHNDGRVRCDATFRVPS